MMSKVNLRKQILGAWCRDGFIRQPYVLKRHSETVDHYISVSILSFGLVQVIVGVIDKQYSEAEHIADVQECHIYGLPGALITDPTYKKRDLYVSELEALDKDEFAASMDEEFRIKIMSFVRETGEARLCREFAMDYSLGVRKGVVISKNYRRSLGLNVERQGTWKFSSESTPLE